MPKVNGFFERSMGLVRGQVAISGALRLVNVTFMIDTGASYTLLLDKDFLYACRALGWAPYKDPEVLIWIRTQPDVFECIGKAKTVAGDTEDIFRIRRSFLWLLHRDGTIPKRWTFQRRIYGTFSADFLNARWTVKDSASHWSLLGCDKLNEFRRLLWSHPKSTIKLTR